VLETKIADLNTSKMSVSEVKKTMDAAITKLTAIDTIYSNSDHYNKRTLIGSIYPEKFSIEDVKLRTAKRSEIFDYI